MGGSELKEIGCKKHPEHKLHPGICSSCLRDKLTGISPTSSSSSSSSSFYSYSKKNRLPFSSSYTPSASATPSVTNSPPSSTDHHQGLKKSRSLIAYATACTGTPGKNEPITSSLHNEKNRNKNKQKKKVLGFLSKLINGGKTSATSAQQGVLMHSKTNVKDRFSMYKF